MELFLRGPRAYVVRFLQGSLIVTLAILPCACAVVRHATADDRAKLAAIYSADQADRAPDVWPAQWEAVAHRDSLRRIQVIELAARARSWVSSDWYHAAVVLQHGSDSADFRRANDWARRAVQLDSTNAQARWLSAASWDRFQMSIGQPQWYGTQNVMMGGLWQLYRIDSTKVTDAERQRLGVPPLDSLRARLNRSNKPKPALDTVPQLSTDPQR